MTKSRESSVDEPDGPRIFVKQRSCTNCFFLFLFLIVLAGWVLVSIFAFKYGDPEQVFLPTDSDGGICGRNKNKDRPYLFYFNLLKCAKLGSITSGCKTPMVCVSKCPDFTITYAEYKNFQKFQALSLEEKVKIKNTLICQNQIGTDFALNEIPTLLRDQKCASLYIKSESRFGRCIPSEFKKKRNKFLDDKNNTIEYEGTQDLSPKMLKDASRALAFTFNAQAVIDKVMNDLVKVKYFIAVGLIVGMVISFSWILLMQVIAGIMVWSSMISLIILSGYFSYFSYNNYKFYGALNDTQRDILENDELDIITEIDFLDLIKVQFSSWLSDRRLWLVLLIISSIIFFLLFVTFVALRQRVRISISLIKEASRAIMEAKFSLLLPIVPYFFQLLLFTFAAVNALLIIATHKSVYRFMDGPKKYQYCDSTEKAKNFPYNCTKFELLDQKYTYWVHGYNLFCFFWVWFFIHGMCQLIFAGVFSRYYWCYDKKRVPQFLILSSTYTAFRYHIGSVALGSFLMATVKIIQVIIEYIDKKCKQYGDNPLARGIIWCFRCCFWLLENFLRYINTNAYIMIAVYGKGYFASAKDAFNLILNNIVRAVIIDKVADYLLLFGKLSVTALMAFGSYLVIDYFPEIAMKNFKELNYAHAVPVVTVAVGTYLISSSFFSVYEMAVDTIFLCFLKDCQENDGSEEKHYYMSSSLLKILNFKNKSTSSSDTKSKVSTSD